MSVYIGLLVIENKFFQFLFFNFIIYYFFLYMQNNTFIADIIDEITWNKEFSVLHYKKASFIN